MHITSAAIRFNNHVVSAPGIHACAWEAAFEQGLMPKPRQRDMRHEDWEIVYLEWGFEEGYLTNTGEFVTRHEALHIARCADQTYKDDGNLCNACDGLHFPDIFSLFHDGNVSIMA
jgi:hypothetical protein